MELGLGNILASLLVVANWRYAVGHAYLREPPARNAVSGVGAQTGGCPHCGNGNGICGDGNQWPSGSNFFSTVQSTHRTYTAGQIVQFDISMNVNHKGHHDFFICDRPISSDTPADVACLQQWPVMRATPEELGLTCAPNDPREDCQPIDANYPGRWYHYTGMSTHIISYKIPAGLQCEACTLQWFWPTANSKAYDQVSYSCYQNQLRAAGWNVFDFCGWACSANQCPNPYVIDTSRPHSPELAAGVGFEEFRNCADIKVLPGSGGSATPRRRRTPVTTPRRRRAPATTPRRRRAPAPQPNSGPATGPLPCSGGGPDGSCKNLCQARCSMQLTTNQCWGTPRYIHCKCNDGSTHSFPGCDCENGACPQGGVTATPAPAVASPEPEPEPEATPAPTVASPEPEPEPEPETETRRRRSTPEPEPEPEPATGSTGGCVDATMANGWGAYSCADIQAIGAAYCAHAEVSRACCFCGVRSLAQTEAGVHQRPIKAHRQRFLGASGSSLIAHAAEKENNDELLLEVADPQDEL